MLIFALFFFQEYLFTENPQGGLIYSKFKAYVHSLDREEEEMDRPGKSKKKKIRLSEEKAKMEASLMSDEEYENIGELCKRYVHSVSWVV